MQTQARYFVSQRFGKSTVTVDTRDDVDGMVSIELPCPVEKTVMFSFEPERAAQLFADPLEREEKIMRIAIQQAHKLFVQHGEAGLFGAPIALVLGTAPWIGDLAGAPYGGATKGYELHQQETAAAISSPPPFGPDIVPA